MLKKEHVHLLWMFLLIGIAILTIGITTYNKLYNDKLFKEIKENTVIIKYNTINSKNEGKLVLVSGDIMFSGVAKDDLFGITVKTPKLLRYVEVYQWYEYTEKINGKTIYKYGKKWSNDLIDSSNFKEKEHKNPTSKIGATLVSGPNDTHIGEFKIAQKLMYTLPCDKKLYLSPNMSLPSSFKVFDNYITSAKDFTKPNVGDFRVSYYYNDWKNATILAKQSKNSFKPYTTKNKEKVYIIEEGMLNLNEMMKKINNN